VILLDTSVWIETFRAHRPLDLTAIVDLDEVATCLPVVQEVLQGFRDERSFRLARAAMLSFPMVESPLTQAVFLEAVALYRAARRAGRTLRSSVDCLIAACALRADLELLHRDRDYAVLASVSALRQRAI
jgi:hypothetical protein